MKYLRAILVDDERLARERMRNLLNEYPGLRVVGTAGAGGGRLIGFSLSFSAREAIGVS